jgi:hypothetical protein
LQRFVASEKYDPARSFCVAFEHIQTVRTGLA